MEPDRQIPSDPGRPGPDRRGPRDRRRTLRSNAKRPAVVLHAAIITVVPALALTQPMLLVLVLCLAMVVLLVVSLASVGSRTAGGNAVNARPLPRRPPPPQADHAWSRARSRFADVRAEYAAHECDPMAVLHLPALSDVTVPSTARFVDAFAEAQALETDAFPSPSHAASFVEAVERAERTWHAARDAAERIRLSALSPEERHAVDRVVRLLTTARDSDSEPERLVAYARARAELAKLDRTGVIHLPRTARAALEAAGRGQLPV